MLIAEAVKYNKMYFVRVFNGCYFKCKTLKEVQQILEKLKVVQG